MGSCFNYKDKKNLAYESSLISQRCTFISKLHWTTTDGKSAIDKCGNQTIAIAYAIKMISFNNYLITDHHDNNFVWKVQEKTQEKENMNIFHIVQCKIYSDYTFLFQYISIWFVRISSMVGKKWGRIDSIHLHRLFIYFSSSSRMFSFFLFNQHHHHPLPVSLTVFSKCKKKYSKHEQIYNNQH